MADLLTFDSVKAVDTVDAAAPERKVLPDARERADALDTRRSWIVEAPAGSGKTGLLIQRYLKLLADDSVTSPEQILAITFTRKATAEILDRVFSQLQAAATGEEPANSFDRETRPLAMAALQRDRERGWSLLDQPGRLQIRSIDSVCSEIARSLPVLSGTGGRLTVVDEAEELYMLAAHQTFLRLGGPDGALSKALRDVLLHRDGDLAHCERLLASLLKLRDQWGKLVPLGSRELDDAYLDGHVLPRLERALEGAICCALTEVSKVFPEHLLRQLTLAAASMAHLAGHKGATSPISICANRTLSPSERAEDLEHWRALIHLLFTQGRSWRQKLDPRTLGFELSKSEQANLRSLIAEFDSREDLHRALCELDNLPPAKYPQEQWLIAKALFRILRHAMAELQVVFAERSECDYAEIALSAKMALDAEAGPDDLEAAIGIRLQHILVDEMQDTASSQYDLIKTLTAHFDGRSQTVFLVGDPKQSIYLFRQARVERFLSSMTNLRLGDVELGLLRLTANFRSQGGLVEDLNADFGRIFPSPQARGNAGEVEFVAASAMRPANHDAANRNWHADLLPYLPKGQTKDASRKQALSMGREVRRIVEEWQCRPLPSDRTAPWKIAILARARGHLAAIVTEFKGSSLHPPIPYRAVSIDPLKERPEVQDLYTLTRALLHPADRTAWLAILRAPWCGLTLADLHILTGADDSQCSDATIPVLIAERGDLLSDDAIERLQRVWPIFMAASANRFRLPLSQIVERTWVGLGGNVYLSAAELENARSYLAQLDALEEQKGTMQLAALEARLGRLFAAPSLEPTAVELLTIHKAKGLEWDVVIVPSLERCNSSNRNELLSWVELDANQGMDGEAAGFLLAPIVGKGEDSAELNRWIRKVQTARETAELKRLFYVACTRAREELHLFASTKLLKNGEVDRRPGTLLKAAWPAAEAEFADALASALALSKVEALPASAAIDEPPLSLAATSGQLSEPPAILKRLPLSFDPARRFAECIPLPHGDKDEAPSLHFERPEGSVAARAFGNAVHVFLEDLTRRMATGSTADSLREAFSTWTPRIAAVLRSEGLPPTMVERLTQRVLHALGATLGDPVGSWLLSPHSDSATEYALTAWLEQRSNIRVDRIFKAGAEPLAAGESCLWIVDYKTTSHGSEGLDVFLQGERKKYAAQLESYADVLKHAKGEPDMRLALYYPLLSKLVWWIP